MDPARDTNFVYYLMSNASLNVFPDNKPQHFKTLLPSPLFLEGEWEVGLSTIIYAHNWNQFKSASSLTVTLPVVSSVDSARSAEEIKIQFDQKQFENLEQLVRLLNESINFGINAHLNNIKTVKKPISLARIHDFAHIEFALSPAPGKKITLKNYGYGNALKVVLPAKIEPARDMWRILGFEDSITQLAEGDEAKNPASLNLHFPALYVYSPIIEYVGVGDTQAPLLAVVPIRGKLGDIIYERYDRPIYLRVRQKYIPEMEISIKDDTGDDVQFGAAKNIVILHFKRKT